MNDRPTLVTNPAATSAAIIVLQSLVRRLYGDIVAEFGLDQSAVGQIKQQFLEEQLQDLPLLNPNPIVRAELEPFIRLTYDTIFDGLGTGSPAPARRCLSLVAKQD